MSRSRACVIEKTGVSANLSRSVALTKGYRWQIFGLFLLVVVIALVGGLVLAKIGGEGLVGRWPTSPGRSSRPRSAPCSLPSSTMISGRRRKASTSTRWRTSSIEPEHPGARVFGNGGYPRVAAVASCRRAWP